MKTATILAALLSLAYGCASDGPSGIADDVETMLLGDLKTWVQNSCDCTGTVPCEDSDLETTADDPEVVCLRAALDDGNEELLASAECYINGVSFMATCSSDALSCVEEELQCEFPECGSGVTVEPFLTAVLSCNDA